MLPGAKNEEERTGRGRGSDERTNGAEKKKELSGADADDADGDAKVSRAHTTTTYVRRARARAPTSRLTLPDSLLPPPSFPGMCLALPVLNGEEVCVDISKFVFHSCLREFSRFSRILKLGIKRRGDGSTSALSLAAPAIIKIR